jgi:hypothetical protein
MIKSYYFRDRDAYHVGKEGMPIKINICYTSVIYKLKGLFVMKKIFATIMACLLTISCTTFSAFAAQPNENHTISPTSDIQPREFMNLKTTQTVYAGNNYAAKITLTFTVRNDSSNATGLYITGILNGTAQKVSGWVSIDPSSVHIIRDGITYSRNNQVASVPITYEGSIGSGYQTYHDIIIIDLFEMF